MVRKKGFILNGIDFQIKYPTRYKGNPESAFFLENRVQGANLT